MKFFVYILICADDTLYTGYTNDLEARVKDHNGETKKVGAKYTRGRRPVELVYSESFKTKSEAMKREVSIKKLSKLEKKKLISS
jgi:putative endonuclease